MELQASNTQLLLQLCSALHDKSAEHLQIKINRYLQQETEATTAFIAPVLLESEEAVVQVIGDQILEQEMRLSIQSHVLGKAIAGPIKLEDLNDDEMTSLNSLLGFTPDTYLSVSVKHPETNNVALLTSLVNYPASEDLERLISLITECFCYTLGTLLNTLAYEEEKRLKIQCQSLLTVARNLFTHLDNISDLLREIMMEARKLTNAERCSLFLLDREHHELVAKVFDGIPAEAGNDNVPEIRIAENQGIAGHVAMTGQLLNIRDAYSHPLFYKGIDEATGFKTRNILCIPIKDEKEVVGIAQLCNKLNGLHFNAFDEEIAVAFSIYCGISIIHSLMYKRVQDAQSRSKLSNELMMYHMKVQSEDVTRLVESPPLKLPPDIASFSSAPRHIPDDDTPGVVIAMFDDLGLLQKWRISREGLARFVLLVKKGYRDPPYHNWMHAFTVAHFAYLLLKNLKLMETGHITELEGLSLIVACLCHDLDHRGTTNSFQLASNSVLAGLYSSEGSVMERHHFSQAMCILNTENCNIFENLSKKDYTKALDLLRDIILATDLAQHLRIMKDQRQLATEGYDRNNEAHHGLLLSLLMTCCDLSDQTKDWRESKKIAKLIYMEFFSQGDLEKAMGNRPMEMMDRDKACIPALQLQFLDEIVLPVYEVLGALFPQALNLVSVLRLNRLCWEKSWDIFSQRWPKGQSHSSMEILGDEELELEVINSLQNSSDT
ncbi:hypothetical protein B566_EDAN005337 [Ephemera danica]|nr:hypothetical protein B566_EDAN005337 [Ephemera danica]